MKIKKEIAFLSFIFLIFSISISSTYALNSTVPNFKVAFIGDQGLGANAIAVLQLIKNEGTNMVLHQGDFDYQDNPTAWDDQINSILGADFPYFATIGNHDALAWSGYQQKLIERLARIPNAFCTGNLGVQSACYYNGLFFTLTAPGTMGSGHDIYIRDQLAQDNSLWSVCSWHKLQRLMQVGGKTDETGWGVYEECRKGGGILATAHEHSYSRTHLMNNFETQSIASTSNTIILEKGKSFAFVSGIGGHSIRPQDNTLASNPWWASVYTATQNATYGALFCTFYVDNQPNKARCYLKDIQNRTIDQFELISNVEAQLNVLLNNPQDNSVLNGTNVAFSCTANDDIEFNNITLYIGSEKTTKTLMFKENGDLINQTNDATISENNPSTNFGSTNDILVDSDDPPGTNLIKRTLIQFPNVFGNNQNQVPLGAKIVKAELTLNIFNEGNNMQAYRVKEDWIESEVTWNQRKLGVSWNNAGAFGSSVDTSFYESFVPASPIEKYIYDITRTVQNWSNGEPNYGILIKETGANGVDMTSSEDSAISNRPLLKITYEISESVEIPWHANQTKSISGTSNTTTFNVVLNDNQSYIWNCLASDNESRIAFAQNNYSFSINSSNILINQPPVANAGPDQILTDNNEDSVESVLLNGSSSYDSDGSIVSYEWEEDSLLIGTGDILTINLSIGNHTIKLIVTDNGGATSSDTLFIEVRNKLIQPSMYVGNIIMAGERKTKGKNQFCRVFAIIPILDNINNFVNEAIVKATWSGAYSSVVEGNTTINGTITLGTGWVKGCGIFSINIDNVSKTGFIYNQSKNIETSDSITL